MNLFNRKAILTFSGVLLYSTSIYLLHFALYELGPVSQYPAPHTLLNWDASYYYSITKDGYLYSEEEFSNSGFFILFPLIWKTLHLSIRNAAFLNVIFYAGAFTLFTRLFDIKLQNKILWLSFPSFFITLVPYTEALFLLLSTLLIWAIVRKKQYLLYLSLFLLSLTRPITIIILPALVITDVLNSNRTYFLRCFATSLLKYGLPLLIGTSIFVWYQYLETGIWFAYFKQQRINWGHEFSLPTLPFGNAFGKRVLWLDAIALFISFYALLKIVGVFIKWLKNKPGHSNNLVNLSHLFFVGIGLVTILFNPTWGINATNIYDIHRYAFVSPFFWILLRHYSIVKKYNWKHYVQLLLLLNFFWLLFGHYRHIQLFLYFNVAGIYLATYLTLGVKHLNKVTYPILVIFNISFQVLLLQWYMSWLYPG